MNKIPILFAFSNQYALPGWVSISSLIISADKETSYNIYVMHEDLEKPHIINISKLVEKSNHFINFINISKMFKELDKVIESKHDPESIGPRLLPNKWPKILYSRLFVSEILPNHEKIIVSDVDVAFKKDLSEIYNKDISQFHYGLVAAENRLQEKYSHERFDFYKNKYIYYSGFVIYNTKKMNKDNICEKFKMTINTYKDKLDGRLTDLIILNMCSRLIYRIPFNYCVLESLLLNENVKDISEYNWLSHLYSKKDLESFRKEPSIIHYSGHGEHREKPWSRLSPPEDYKKLIYSSPYKHNWIAKKYLTKVIRKNQLFLHFSNTKLYKKYFGRIFHHIFLFIINTFGPTFWKYMENRIKKENNKKVIWKILK